MSVFNELIRKLGTNFLLAGVALFPLHFVLMASLGLWRWDHVLVTLTVLFLTIAHPKTRQFFLATFGFFVIFILYDLGRFVSKWGITSDRVLNCDLNHWESYLFGFRFQNKHWTLQDFFLEHHHLLTDFLFAIPYGLFIWVSFAYAVFLFFKHEHSCKIYSWSFFVLNLLGIITYHLFPAAPPWYFHQYGCAIRLESSGFEGWALARVDSWMGVPYFQDFYGKAAEVFGAIPSLHAAYPLLILLEGWSRNNSWRRAFCMGYVVWMAAAAIYLDHHWTIDIFLGWIYALVTYLCISWKSPASSRSLIVRC